jgi:hypothetical protein
MKHEAWTLSDIFLSVVALANAMKPKLMTLECRIELPDGRREGLLPVLSVEELSGGIR